MLGEKQEREETPTREGRKGRATRVPHKAGKSAQCHLLQPWPGTQLETAQPQLETQLEMAQPRPGTQLEAQPRGARAYPTVQTTHHTPGHSADPRCILHPRTLQKEPLAMGKETPWATPSPLSHTQDTASTTGIIPFPSLLHSSSLEALTKLSELRSLPGSAELQNSLGYTLVCHRHLHLHPRGVRDKLQEVGPCLWVGGCTHITYYYCLCCSQAQCTRMLARSTYLHREPGTPIQTTCLPRGSWDEQAEAGQTDCSFSTEFLTTGSGSFDKNTRKILISKFQDLISKKE